MTVSPASENYSLDRILDREISLGSELEAGFVLRLFEGFAYPNGSIYWSMYLSKISPFAADFIKRRLESRGMASFPMADFIEMRTVRAKILGGTSSLKKRVQKELLAGFELADCGMTDERNYTSMEAALSRVGVDLKAAAGMARPAYLRSNFQGYVDLLVRANNEMYRVTRTKNETSVKEVGLIRNHQFSDAAMLHIARSPIAVTYLAALDQASAGVR